MINSSLQAFASNVQKAGRISFGDVQRLQRDILPDGISSRAEAELLLTLDQSVSRADRAFADWLVAMMVDFVVWGMRPTGTVDAETAAWLTPILPGLPGLEDEIRKALRGDEQAPMSYAAQSPGNPGQPWITFKSYARRCR